MIALTQEFLDTPIAELEAYGVGIRAINQLEEKFKAIYVRDLQSFSAGDLLKSSAFVGPLEVGALVKGLKLLRKDCVTGSDSRKSKYRETPS